MAYAAHTVHNTALVSLTTFVIQPTCEGLMYTRSTSLGDHTVWNEGPYLPFVWRALQTVAQYQAILTIVGLASADIAEVTVYGPDKRYNLVRYNATVTLPISPTGIGRRNIFLRDLTLNFTDLVAL